jgi:hypothetical protein
MSSQKRVNELIGQHLNTAATYSQQDRAALNRVLLQVSLTLQSTLQCHG